MKIDRRAFLGFAAAGPLVFGLRDLVAGTSQEAPAWWKAALARMKEQGRPALVFVGPGTEEGREKLGSAIRDLLESGDSRAREVFCASVVICLHPDVAASCLSDIATPGRILVLDALGQVVDKAELRWDSLKDGAAFNETYSSLLYGEGDARLAAAADRLREQLTPAERKAWAELASETVAVRERATAELTPRADVLMPLLVYERRNSQEPERRGRAGQIIDDRFDAADEKTPGPRLPFGTRFTPGRGGCGAEMEEVPVQCGMGRLEGKGQRFLRFLDK